MMFAGSALAMLHDQLQVVLSAPILASVSCHAVQFVGREAVVSGLFSFAEARGGRLWATSNSPYAAVFQSTLQQAGDQNA
jgi:hypothetical protein